MPNETQDKETREKELAKSPSGAATATGQARENDSGKEDERLKDADRRPTPEGAPKAGDFAPVDYPKPQGLQKEPANFSPTGTIPAEMVSSPGGFIPISSVAGDELEARLESTYGKQPIGDQLEELTDEQLVGMDGPSVRAVGLQRGYRMPEMAGSRTMRATFLREQGKDERFAEGKDSGKKGLAARVLGGGK
jgi:hypothetical protein